MYTFGGKPDLSGCSFITLSLAFFKSFLLNVGVKEKSCISPS